MPTRDKFVEEVDHIFSQQKELAGTDGVRWQAGRNEDEMHIVFPVEMGGIQEGIQLHLLAYPKEQGKFSITLVWRIAVCRLDVSANDTHGNGLSPLDGLPALVTGPHFHAWAINRRLIESASKLQRLRMAAPYTGSVKFMAALRWFCGEANIMVPHSISIDLPSSRRLI